MAHLEVINIRCFDRDIDSVLKRFIAPLLCQQEVTKDWEIKVYRHYRLDMEISISIVNKHGKQTSQKSDFGIQLVENLKPFGIVYHSAWEELSF